MYGTGSDHDGNIEMDFLPWMEGLMKFLKNSISLDQDQQFRKLFIKGLYVELRTLSDDQVAQL